MKNTIRCLALMAAAVCGQAATLDELFDDSVVHDLRLTIHPSDWQKLRQNFQDDTYYPAILTWRGTKVENIAVRSRGNGSRSGDKPGLKVDFNRYEPIQFLGLTSLVLDNLTQDPSMMAERLSMLMFRKMGLPAPRVAHARLLVNGTPVGLYTMVEPVDKGFLRRNLGEDGGDLYDYEWAGEYWFEDLGEDPSAYLPLPFQPETNKSHPDSRSLVRLIQTVNEASDTEFVTAISSFLDVKLFLTYLATEMYLADRDGLLGEWGINNFYLYRLQGRSLFVFIPWDKDVTFSTPAFSIGQNTDRNVLVRRILSTPELREYYLQALERCTELGGGPWIEREIDTIYNQIQVAAAEDPNRPYTYSDFEEGVNALRFFAFERDRMVSYQVEDVRAAVR